MMETKKCPMKTKAALTCPQKDGSGSKRSGSMMAVTESLGYLLAPHQPPVARSELGRNSPLSMILK